MTSVAAIVPCFNRRDLTLRFLARFQPAAPHRVVVVDDGSTDGTAAAVLTAYPQVKVLTTTGDRWWAGATNVGVAWALEHGFTHVLTINDDSQPEPELLTALLAAAAAHPRAIIGSRIMRADDPGRVWSLGTRAPFAPRRLWIQRDQDRLWADLALGKDDLLPCDTLCGNGTLVPTNVFRAIGLYDEENLPQYHADSDLVLRAVRAGWQPLVATSAVLLNHGEGPLPVGIVDLVFHRRSPLRLRALVVILIRHAPWWRIVPCLLGQVLPPVLRRLVGARRP